MWAIYCSYRPNYHGNGITRTREHVLHSELARHISRCDYFLGISDALSGR
jgi:hypothetical protein